MLSVIRCLLGCMQTETTQAELEQKFSEYGPLDNINYVNKDKGARGFAFVTFQQTSSMEKALIVRQIFHGRTVDCKRAQSKEDHEMQSQNQGAVRGPPGGMPGRGPGGPGGAGGMGPGAGGPMPRHSQGGYGSYSPDGRYQGGYGPGAPGGGYGGYGGGPYGPPGGFDPYAGYGGPWGAGGYGGYGGGPPGFPPADAWGGAASTSSALLCSCPSSYAHCTFTNTHVCWG